MSSRVVENPTPCRPPSRFVTAVLVPALVLAGGLRARAARAELRLGYFPNITHAQALHARATGDWDRKLDRPIRWAAFNAGPTAVEALLTDAVDASFLGPSPTINGYVKSRGRKFVVIAGAACGGAGLVVRKDAGIRSDGDFHRKVIATPQFGNTQDIAARWWFENHGYRLRDRGGTVSIVPLSNPDQLTMFRKRQIDGAWTIEPWLARLELEADGEVYLEEKSLWPEGRYVTTHLVVTRSFLRSHRDTVRQLLERLVETTETINADREAALPFIDRQLRTETGKGLDPAVLKRAFGRVELTWEPVATSLVHLADTAHRIRFLRQAPDLRGIHELDLLNDVLRARSRETVAGLDPTP